MRAAAYYKKHLSHIEDMGRTVSNTGNMGLLDDITVSIEIPTKAKATHQATRLLKKHTTRRGKKKKKPRDAKWLRKVAEARKEEELIKKQLSHHFSELRRHLA